MTGTCGIPHQMPTKLSAVWKSRIRSRQPRARCLGSDCQFNNLLVIRPQNIGRLPVVTAPTVCAHLICSRLLTQKLFVIIYSQSFPSEWLHTRLGSGWGHLCDPLLRHITQWHNYETKGNNYTQLRVKRSYGRFSHMTSVTVTNHTQI